MPIQFRCPQCKTRLSISRKRSGSDIKCPSCMAVVQVPSIEGGPKPVSPKSDPDAEPVSQSESESAPFRKPLPNEQQPVSSKPTEESPITDISSTKPDTKAPGPVIVGPPPEEEEEEEFSIRSMETDMEDMDLTPMVDVTFLLLIFFMISASFSLQKTMQFPPPERDEEGASPIVRDKDEVPEVAVQIEIDENNKIMIGPELELVQDPALVSEKIAQYARQLGSQEVMLKTHERALTDTVVWVFDSAAEAGIQRTRISTISD